VTITKSLPPFSLTLEIKLLGSDLLVVLHGGDAPHIGSAVLAQPRPSLRDENVISSTSSVINLLGHKDEAICRAVAEALCARFGRVTLCTGGFHVDGITAEKIATVQALTRELISAAIFELEKDFGERP